MEKLCGTVQELESYSVAEGEFYGNDAKA
jgi:hypothetical protein